MSPEERVALVVSVPWPLRLFGDYQDFLELPSIVMAADLRTAIVASPCEGETSTIIVPGLANPIRVNLDQMRDLPELPGFTAALGALATRHETLHGAYNFKVLTNAPWFDRIPDSPALLVGWIGTFLALNNTLGTLSGQELAELALQTRKAEPVFKRQRAEIYATTLGGTLLMRPDETPEARPLERNLPGIVMGSVQGVTGDTMAAPVAEMLKALLSARQAYPEFDVRRSTMEETVGRLREISEQHAGLTYAQLRLRDICRDALETLEFEEGFDDDRLGELMDETNEMLRDYMGLHDERLDGMMEAAVGAGALGCRIIPGCAAFIAFGGGRADDVLKAIRDAGGHARLANATDGIRLEETTATGTSHAHHDHEHCDHDHGHEA